MTRARDLNSFNREDPHNISSTHFDIYENQAAQRPLSYTLVARKGR